MPLWHSVKGYRLTIYVPVVEHANLSGCWCEKLFHSVFNKMVIFFVPNYLV